MLVFLHYYEWKQVPNFMLAFPVLFFGCMAACSWIYCSWIRYGIRQRMTMTDKADGDKKTKEKVHSSMFLPLTVKHFIQWALYALRTSVDPSHEMQGIHQRKIEMPFSSFGNMFAFEANDDDEEDSKHNQQSAQLMALIGPHLLAHYAVLAGFVLICATVAHVQISTRMICSSCPAWYWFIAAMLMYQQNKQQRNTTGRGYILLFGRHYDTVSLLIWGYFGLYNALGVVLHVNFLPWT
mmetsp:Transcript_38500/g.58355  ORF Transcript_38500/g.58355 Transcript_38500/m.58355 type:complete len:238 (+) Transcript_38500:63-776(+)